MIPSSVWDVWDRSDAWDAMYTRYRRDAWDVWDIRDAWDTKYSRLYGLTAAHIIFRMLNFASVEHLSGLLMAYKEA